MGVGGRPNGWMGLAGRLDGPGRTARRPAGWASRDGQMGLGGRPGAGWAWEDGQMGSAGRPDGWVSFAGRPDHKASTNTSSRTRRIPSLSDKNSMMRGR